MGRSASTVADSSKKASELRKDAEEREAEETTGPGNRGICITNNCLSSSPGSPMTKVASSEALGASKAFELAGTFVSESGELDKTVGVSN